MQDVFKKFSKNLRNKKARQDRKFLAIFTEIFHFDRFWAKIFGAAKLFSVKKIANTGKVKPPLKCAKIVSKARFSCFGTFLYKN